MLCVCYEIELPSYLTCEHECAPDKGVSLHARRDAKRIAQSFHRTRQYAPESYDASSEQAPMVQYVLTGMRITSIKDLAYLDAAFKQYEPVTKHWHLWYADWRPQDVTKLEKNTQADQW